MVTRARDVPEAVVIAPAQLIDLQPLLGLWVNYNPNATGIARVEIGDWEGTPTVRAFGASSPEPTNWGEVAGAAFTDGVDRGEAVAFTANFDLRFARVLLAGYLNKRLLVVDAYTTFTDGSARASYFQRDHFYLP